MKLIPYKDIEAHSFDSDAVKAVDAGLPSGRRTGAETS